MAPTSVVGWSTFQLAQWSTFRLSFTKGLDYLKVRAIPNLQTLHGATPVMLYPSNLIVPTRVGQDRLCS